MRNPILSLMVFVVPPPPSPPSYRIIDIKDYTFKQLLDEGLNTIVRQLDILKVPIRQCKFIVKWHIKRHRFLLNKGKNKVNETTFRAIAYAYPSVSPQGDSIMLSGLITIPVLSDNKPTSILVYHRVVAPSYQIAPSNSLPIEAVLSADNTICVFPDYYGCGITEGEPFPYIALNYHARSATDALLSAFKIINDSGVELDKDFYTWNTGYSQGGGYALAMHKYIETSLHDSLRSHINLKWSLCGGGIYSPNEMYENMLTASDMGSIPAVYLESLRSIFYTYEDYLGDFCISDFLSDEAVSAKMDSLLLDHDDSLWDLTDRLGKLVDNSDPNYYFSPMALDTNTPLFKSLYTSLCMDDCSIGWNPDSTVVLYHSKRDECIPYQQTLTAYSTLVDNNGNCCMYNPVINGTHSLTSIFFYAKLLRLYEGKLFKKYTKKYHNVNL